MTEKRRKSIVYGILVVAIIWGIWNNPFAAKKKEMDTPQPVPANSAQVANAGIAAPVVAGDDSIGGLSWKDDPFVRDRAPRRHTDAVSKKAVQYKLSAISTSGGGSMAIVNGQILKQGGTIDDWMVAGIDDNAVLLKKGSENLKLTLRRR